MKKFYADVAPPVIFVLSRVSSLVNQAEKQVLFGEEEVVVAEPQAGPMTAKVHEYASESITDLLFGRFGPVEGAESFGNRSASGRHGFLLGGWWMENLVFILLRFYYICKIVNSHSFSRGPIFCFPSKYMIPSERYQYFICIL